VKIDMKAYGHVIWDWNGTLLDDAWLCVEVLNGILESRDKVLIGLDQYQEEFSFPVRQYYEESLGFNFSEESFDDIADEYLRAYNRRRYECRLQRGANDVLSLLDSKGVNQMVLSAYPQGMLNEAIGYYGISDMFNEVIGMDDFHAASKIDNGKLLLEKLDCQPKDVLLIGDTVHDYEVAQAIAVKCLLIPSGHNSAERLVSCGAMVVETLELLDFF